jgi:hypothetical protein
MCVCVRERSCARVCEREEQLYKKERERVKNACMCVCEKGRLYVCVREKNTCIYMCVDECACV